MTAKVDSKKQSSDRRQPVFEPFQIYFVICSIAECVAGGTLESRRSGQGYCGSMASASTFLIDATGADPVVVQSEPGRSAYRADYPDYPGYPPEPSLLTQLRNKTLASIAKGTI